MYAKEIMTKGVIMVDPATSISDVADIMKNKDIGAVPVGKGESIEGIVTDRDIVVRGIAMGEDIDAAPVSKIMSREVSACYEDSDIREAAELMQERKIRRLIVLDHEDRPVGMISLGDIAAHHLMRLAERTLEEVSEPVHSK